MTLASRAVAPRLSVRPPTCLAPRRKVCPRVRATTERESPLAHLQELFGATGDDPGHWNLSPEWFGTQNGGWGRDAGQEVFSADSACGNGRVTVTAHEATQQEGAPGAVQEWRVLRFNDATRQSVARVSLAPPSVPTSSHAHPISSTHGSTASNGKPDSTGQHRQLGGAFLPSTTASGTDSSGGGWTMMQQADCLAPEYLKTMASLAAALSGMQGLLPNAGHSHDGPSTSTLPPEQGPLRVLCIGLGGGSLPLFVTHHFPRAVVDAVELDPVVLAAATQAMGLPTTLPNLRLHRADAFQFVRDFVVQQQQHGQQERGRLYDLVLLDAFDGEDNVPEALCSPGFAKLLAAALHPRHGALVINMHNKDPARPVILPGFLLGRLAPPSDLGYDPKSPTGQRIVQVATTFATAFQASSSPEGIGCSGGSGGSRIGVSRNGGNNGIGDHSRAEGTVHRQQQVPVRAFTVSVPKQLNVEVVVARGLNLEQEAGLAGLQLKAMAAYVAGLAGYRFPAGRRAVRGFCELL
ncbi:hypothetical protein N2152v2_001167 [Parachlorella kessleri]